MPLMSLNLGSSTAPVHPSLVAELRFNGGEIISKISFAELSKAGFSQMV